MRLLILVVVLCHAVPCLSQEVAFTSTEAAEQTRKVDLSAIEMHLLTQCNRKLSKTEKIELAENDPQNREDWLRARCGSNNDLFVMCSTSLTVELQKTYTELSKDAQYLWLQLHCKKTLRGEMFDPPAVPGGDPYHMLHDYRICKHQLSTQEQLDFSKLNPNQRIFWLDKHCKSVKVAKPPNRPTVVAAPTYAPFTKKTNSGLRTARIVAHSFFWPGVVCLGTGLSLINYAKSSEETHKDLLDSAKVNLVYETRATWAPFIVSGGFLTFVGIFAGLRYVVLKSNTKRGYALLTPSKHGLTLGYSRTF